MSDIEMMQSFAIAILFFAVGYLFYHKGEK